MYYNFVIIKETFKKNPTYFNVIIFIGLIPNTIFINLWDVSFYGVAKFHALTAGKGRKLNGSLPVSLLMWTIYYWIINYNGYLKYQL